VLYGVGARLDKQPELLFLLRGVNHDELIDDRLDKAVAGATARGGRRRTVDSDRLGDVFGIELAETTIIENGSDKTRSATSRKKSPKRKATIAAKPKSRKKQTIAAVKIKVTKKPTGTKSKKIKEKRAVDKKTLAAPEKATKKSTRKKTTPSKSVKITARKKTARR
jgi:uncharacterized Zn finger protein